MMKAVTQGLLSQEMTEKIFYGDMTGSKNPLNASLAPSIAVVKDGVYGERLVSMREYPDTGAPVVVLDSQENGNRKRRDSRQDPKMHIFA